MRPFVEYPEAYQADYAAFMILLSQNVYQFNMFYCCVMTYMMCFTFDLNLTIKNPLYPASKRLITYNVITLVVTMILVIGALLNS